MKTSLFEQLAEVEPDLIQEIARLDPAGEYRRVYEYSTACKEAAQAKMPLPDLGMSRKAARRLAATVLEWEFWRAGNGAKVLAGRNAFHGEIRRIVEALARRKPGVPYLAIHDHSMRGRTKAEMSRILGLPVSDVARYMKEIDAAIGLEPACPE